MIIQDKQIEPFEIHIDSNSFTVGKVSKNKKGELVFIAEKYFTSLLFALEYITREKVIMQHEAMTLAKYVDSINKNLSELKKTIKQ